MIDGDEGAAYYGGFILSTGPVLTADANGEINSQCAVFNDPDLTGNFDERVVVITGHRIDGIFDDNAPAACGVLIIRPNEKPCRPRRSRHCD